MSHLADSFFAGAKKHRPEEIRPVPLASCPKLCLLARLPGIGDLPVPVLVIGCDEVGIAEDSVLVDVEAVELLLGLDPDADGRLERREDGERGEEDEAAGRDDAESLDAELVEPPP